MLIPYLRHNRYFQKAHFEANPQRPELIVAAAATRSTSGFTLVELCVVLAIVSVLIIAGLLGVNHYRSQYAFSAAVRELSQAINVARVRAIQTQSNARLIFRPREATPIALWLGPPKPATAYNVGDIVQHGQWAYRCISAHTSAAATEPSAGDSWTQAWEIIYDYQYSDLLVDIQHCTGDPNGCVWANTKPYNVGTPVSIQFNWFGVPVDYVDHNIRVRGERDLALGLATNTLGDLTLTVTALGRIRHLSWDDTKSEFIGESK